MRKKLRALLLATALVFALAAPALAATGGETVYIDTAEDLLVFAANCRLDTWSQGKQVVLRADISLSGADFEPIPSFGGRFLGRGHTISGLRLSAGASPAGLFAVVQAGARVSLLHVSGSVAPAGAAVSVGGVAGVNYGTITGCSFSGNVTGKSSVGGIAGVNGLGGTLNCCSAQGSVTGESATGGIAGNNLGDVTGCTNQSFVNTTGADPTLHIEDLDASLALNMSALLSLDSLHTATDTGGIAGYSTGTIAGCTNESTVGYQHTGYNTGGIAGRSCGAIRACANTGAVYGRKDVGGIAGQVEPYILVSLSADVLEELRTELDEMSGLLDTALNHASGSMGAVTARLNALAGYVSSAGAALGNLDVPSITVPSSPTPDDISSAVGDAVDAVTGGGEGGGAQTQIDVNAALSRLSGAVNGISSQIRLLSGEIAGGSGALTGDFKAINEKAGKISDLLFDALSQARGAKLSDVVSDTSSLDIDAVTFGKVSACVNSGVVAGDISVGGVAGSMAMEYSLDPEDDISSELDLSQNRQYELKAILQGCVNRGTVNARKNYAGGLCGRMDLGLISACEGYGSVASEGGSYVGGIAGIAKSTLRGCYAKCTLRGESYVGGIVGSGYTDAESGGAATVAGCVSMVEIPACGQYCGAVSGYDAGSYSENVFVSDTLCGINGRSYTGQAEPLRYAQLLGREGLPEEFRQFTLRFLVDGEAVKTLDFAYGDSFESDVFPELPAREGYTAAWDQTQLRLLHFDTDVNAVYTPYVTALPSASLRGNGRPVFYAEGGFEPTAWLDAQLLSPGDEDPKLAAQRLLTASASQGPVSGLRVGYALAEHWLLTLPDNGEESHALRFLPPSAAGEHPALYLRGADGLWSYVPTQTVGSYLRFEARGDTVELAVLSTLSVLWLWLLLPGAALAMVLGGVLLAARRRRKRAAPAMAAAAPDPAPDAAASPSEAAEDAAPAKPAPEAARRRKRKQRRLAALAVAVVLLGALGFALRPGSGLRNGFTAAIALRRFLAQEEYAAALTVDGAIGDVRYESEAALTSTRAEDKTFTCIRRNGIAFYLHAGTLYLENGRAYAVGGALPDSSRLPKLAERFFRSAAVSVSEESRGKLYTLSVPGADAGELLALLAPAAGEALEVETARLSLLCDGTRFLALRVAGEGTLGADRAPFTLRAELSAEEDAELPAVPAAVLRSAAAQGAAPQTEISGELLDFLSAVAQLSAQDPLRAEITLSADCAPLLLSDTLEYTRTRVSGRQLGCVSRGGSATYFTDAASCDKDGHAVSGAAVLAADPAGLMELAYQLLLNGALTREETESGAVYSLALGEEELATAVQAIAPEAAKLSPLLTAGSLQAVLSGGKLTRLGFVCTGSIPVVVTAVPVTISAQIALDYTLTEFPVPEAVLAALLG